MPTTFLTPFQLSGGRVASTTDTFTQIDQKILSVLTTDLFERVGISSYGAGINQLLFDPIDDLVSADYRTDALNELADRVGDIIFTDIRLAVVNDTQADITVYYRLPLADVRQTTFRIALPNSLTEETGF